MAKLYSSPLASSTLSTTVLFAIPKQLIPISNISSESHLIPLNKRLSYLRVNCRTDPCFTSSVESHQSPSKIVFIKGLSFSTSEGVLKKAFSQFGEVTRVKVVSNKKTKQSLGFAFVWFTNEESALLAVNEMNGKFYDGRFISVTISKPGSCKTSKRETPYEF